MFKFIKQIITAVTIATFLFGITSCKKKDDAVPQTTGSKYSSLVAVGSWPNIAYYIMDVPSLKKGQVNLTGNGAEITSKVYAQDVIQRKGHYYHANNGAGILGKYHVEGGILITDKEIPYSWLNWSSVTWVDDETLVLFGTGPGNEARYSIVKVKNMSVTNGTLSLTAFPSGFNIYNIGFAEYRNSKIFLGYGIGSNDYSNYPVMPVNQKAYVAVISYPSMDIDKTLEDARTSNFGGSNVYNPFSYIDENNDIYFVCDPVYTYDYDSPSAVYRIKSGETELDDDYYYDLSADANGGMGAGIWYIGSGKAIIRTCVAGQSIDADHNFYLINAQTGTMIKKLDLPVDKGERMIQAVVVEDGKAYIAVNAVDRDYVWEYDPATDVLTKGLEYVGGINYVLRIEKVRD